MQIHCLCEAFMILFAKMWLTKGIYRFDARYMLPPSSLKCNNEKKIIFSPLKSIFFRERNYVVAVVITEKKSVI